MCKHLWWWLLHGSGYLCKMLAHMHTVCVTNELYGLCKRTAITKWWMSNNVRPRVSYVIKPFQMHSDAHTKSEKVMVRTETLWLLHCDFVSSIVFSCVWTGPPFHTIQNDSKLRWYCCCTWDCKCVCVCDVNSVHSVNVFQLQMYKWRKRLTVTPKYNQARQFKQSK